MINWNRNYLESRNFRNEKKGSQGPSDERAIEEEEEEKRKVPAVV